MSPEEFENKLQQNDPAASLQAMSEADIESVVSRVTSKPVKAGSTKKWLLGTAAVAVAAFALNAPGANVASAPLLRLSGGNNSSTAGAKVAGGESLTADTAPSDQNRMAMMLFTRYVSDKPLPDSPFADSMAAYKLVAIDNIGGFAKKLIQKFGIKDVQTSDENGQKVWFNNVVPTNTSDDIYMYVYDGTYAGFSVSRYNAGSSTCAVSEPATGSDTTPVKSDCAPEAGTLSDAKLKSLSLAFLSEMGLPTSDLSWNLDKSFGNYVTAIVMQDGFESPINFWFAFDNDGNIISASGSLQKLVKVGDYNLVSPAEAVARANKQMDAWREQANQPQVATDDVAPSTENVDPVSSESSAVSSGSAGASSEPRPAQSASDEPLPAPTFSELAAQEAHVTSVQLTMMMVWDVDGNALWIPGYALYGYYGEPTDNFMIGTVIAVVDSQIDMSQFGYGYGQVMPMMAK